MINYIFYTLVSLCCAYLVYYFFLKTQKTFQFNRFFLLSTLVLALIAPFLEIPVFETIPSLTEISIQPSNDLAISHEIIQGEVVSQEQNYVDSFFSYAWYLYLIISLGFTIRFIKNLIDIFKLTRHSYKQIGRLNLIHTKDLNNTSSFFNYVFINSEQLEDKQYSEPIIQHELVHSQQYHTLDIIIVEMVLCVFWFNPFIWLFKTAMIQNHEFIADTLTVNTGFDIESYSKIIIHTSQMEHRVPLTSGFNFIQIKNRIIMLHQSKSSVFKRTVKITTALILFSGIFMFSSFKDIKVPLIVVVDAAHGGKDSGHLNEKDIVLKISKQLSNLSDDKIKIITIRNEDKFYSLQERVAFVNAQNPDLMLSLHCNTIKNTSIHGLEAFYTNQNENEKASLGYGWLLLNQQMESKIVDKGEMKTANFYMLKHIKCPGVLMELGFLSNEKDNQRLNNSKHQKDIAQALYKGLLEIRDKKELIEILNKN